jgi:hypothetical protein
MSAPVSFICPKWRLLAEVCDALGVSLDDVLSMRRVEPLVNARYLFAFVCKRRWPEVSYPMLARILRRGDHSTVVHGVQAFAERMARDPKLSDLVDRLLDYRPVVVPDSHVRLWSAQQAEAQRKRLAAVRAIAQAEQPERLEGYAETVEIATAQIDARRKVKDKNRLANDDYDAVRRAAGSDGLSAAIAAAGGWR